ncbi:MAG: patatin-like phospholipase family protein [Gemmatimonadaceae bacterium]
MTNRAHRPFALVFGGGGARGFAHLGVLRGLERDGYYAERIVGMSMGALVGVTYGSRPEWNDAVLAISLSDFPGPTAASTSDSSAIARSQRRGRGG